jgi:hypothetical protein
MSLFVNDMVLYIENPQKSSKKKKKNLWEQTNEFSTFIGFKIKLQKSVELLFVNKKII